MMFFPSNLGYSDAQQRSNPIGYHDEADRNRVSDQDVRADLRRRLRPEFINRVRMIHFNRLTQLSAERILDLEFDRIARRYDEVHGVRLVLDPSAQSVAREGRSLELTGKEFQVLDLLMTDPARVYSRTDIIEHVYDDDFDANSNVIDVFLSRLRRKLNSDGGATLIRTVRGVGYSFRAAS